MKKLIVVSIRNAAKSDFGGGEKVPVFIARELINHDSKLHIVVCSSSEKLLSFARHESVPTLKTWWWPRQNWNGWRVLLFPLYILWQVILTLYYILLFLRLRPSVVHLQSKDDFIAGTLAGKILGKRVIWSDYADLKHIWKNHSIWYKNPVGKLVYFCAQMATQIIVVSKEDKRLILENIPRSRIAKKLKVIYNGAFDAYTGKVKEKEFTVVSASRLVVDKGIGELIEAFGKLHVKHPDTKLKLLGDGPDKDRFINQARDNPAISFLGHQQNPSKFIESAHVFALPTYHEGFSLALVEACMHEVAIITTKVGGNPEIIDDGKNGLLIEPRSSDALYRALDRLYSDSHLRTKLATNARSTYAQKFNFQDIIINEFLPLYKGGV